MSTTYVAIDVETTGLDPQKDVMIEVAAVTCRDGRVIDEWSSLIQTRRELPPYITRLTGITPKMVEDAPEMKTVRPQLRRILGDHVLVGHNVAFDLGFLREEGLALGSHRLDTLTLATILYPTAGRYGLESLSRHLGLIGPNDNQVHRALDDARQTAALLGLLQKRAMELDAEVLDEVIRAGQKLGWPETIFFTETLAAIARRAFEPGSQSHTPGRLKHLFQPAKLTGRPLVAAETPTPLDPPMITGLLQPEGNFSRLFPAYEYRPQQVQMVEAVTQALNRGQHLLVEAGTGTGKCLNGDTWITLKSGRRMTIGELSQAPTMPSEPILCVTPAGKLTYQNIKAIHFNGIRSVWRLSTGLGRTITATANHPFLTLRGWQSLETLKTGDRIATVRCLPAGKDSLPTHEAFVAGAMLGDGACGYPESPQFINFDLDVVMEVSQNVARLGNVRMVSTKRAGAYGFRRLTSIGHERSGLTLLLERLDMAGRNAHSKHIPAPYFQADEETISYLLAGLWLTDGSVERRDGHLSFSSVSERMIFEVQHLLLKLKIISRVRYQAALLNGTRFDSWNLTISDRESKLAFWKTVGQLMVGAKRQRLETWWDSHSQQKYNPNDDLLPIDSWELINETRKRASKSWYAIRQKCTISSDRTREISRAKMRTIGEFLESPDLTAIATSDLYWDRITSIEPAGEIQTFDLTMAGEPNFVANDIVVHNSVAYLMPAAFWANQNGRRVVVSTNTINLQDQLIQKDLPELQRILPFEVRAAVLKGKRNYLCTRLFQQMRHSGPSNADEMALYARLLVWLPQSATGDVNEISLRNLGETMAWSRLSADNDVCQSRDCDEAQCPLSVARRRAEQAHVLVVNHALLLADIATDNRVLPEYADLIIDEAHHLEAAVTDSLSFRTDKRYLEATLEEVTRPRAGLVADLQNRAKSSLPAELSRLIDGSANRVREQAQSTLLRVDEFFTTLGYFLEPLTNRRGQFAEQVRFVPDVRAQAGFDELVTSWDNLYKSLTAVVEGLGKLAGGLADVSEGYPIEDGETLRLSLVSLVRTLDETRQHVQRLVRDPAEGVIYWAEIFKERISLHAAPLHVGPLVEKHIFTTKEAVVLTSATLRTAEPGRGRQTTFTYLRDRLNAQDAQELAVGSPFDYKNSTLVYLCTDIPEPQQPGYQSYVEQAIVTVAQALGGRTMALFTANAQLANTGRAIERPLAEANLNLLLQTEGSSRQQLLTHFKADGSRSVLLGTRSFWEGVDVPGDALQCIVIVKLPFDVPSDPIFAARSETYDNPFYQYSVPEAVLRFRQGFGRLIRRQDDQGIVVILDKRVLTKSYGQLFLDALPDCTIIRQPVGRLGELSLRWLNRERVK